MVKAKCFRTPHRCIVERIVSGSQRKYGSCGENSRRDNKNAVAQPPCAAVLAAAGSLGNAEFFRNGGIVHVLSEPQGQNALFGRG